MNYRAFIMVLMLLAGFVALPVLAQEQEKVPFQVQLPEDKNAPEPEPAPPPKPLTDTEPTDEESIILNNIYRQLPAIDQQRLIDEAITVEARCESRDIFAMLHDCQCVASKFFEERIKHPELDRNIIHMADKLADECPNIPGVAGYAFNECMTNHVMSMPVGAEEFCTCYANVFANAYKQDPRSYFPLLGKVGAAAIVACDAKGMPSPINPHR